MSYFDMHLAFIRKTFGDPRREPAGDPREVAVSVLQGDGKFDEAAAAVAYWCDYSREEAEQLVGELLRNWHGSA